MLPEGVWRHLCPGGPEADGTFDYDAIREKINGRTKLITIQRSKGYATRPSFSVRQIGELIAFCKGSSRT